MSSYQRKQWVPRARKEKNLVAASLVEALSEAKGELDAAKEAAAPEPEPKVQYVKLDAEEKATLADGVNFDVCREVDVVTDRLIWVFAFIIPVGAIAVQLALQSSVWAWPCLLLFISASCVAYWWSWTVVKDVEIIEKYRLIKTISVDELQDRRADGISMGKGKHWNPLMAWVKVTTLDDEQPLVQKESRILISLELLSQIMLHKNTKSTLTPDLVYQKLEFAASTINSVNLDRYRVLGSTAQDHQNVPDNTVVVAFALWRKMRFDTRHLVKGPRALVVP